MQTTGELASKKTCVCWQWFSETALNTGTVHSCVCPTHGNAIEKWFFRGPFDGNNRMANILFFGAKLTDAERSYLQNLREYLENDAICR